MNTLFIIGNGFDINLGLNTKYSDFYSHYHSLKSNSQLVHKLKSSISENFENWADLELAIGNYTENINSCKEFDELYEDMVEQLALYLEGQEKQFDPSSARKEQFYLDLIFPETYLLPADSREIVAFKNTWINSPWAVNIMTLNYTRTIEKIIGDEITNKKIGTHNSKYDVYLQTVEHIHGFIDNRMIMGVNDISQIKNVNLHDNIDILEALIKSNSNKVAKQIVQERCENLIKTANLIYIFGSSIGDTDKIWWELIGQQLKRDCKLIIFRRGVNINSRFHYKIARHDRESKEYFLNKTGLSDDEKNKIRSNIYMGIETNIFSKLLNR